MCVDRALFPCGDAMVCIIDDREDVWKMAPNLVHVRPYRFFDGTADINAPPEASKTDVDDKSKEAGVSVKTTRRNVRIMRVPKHPRDVNRTAESSKDSAADVSSVSTASNTASDNCTSVGSQLMPDATATAAESSSTDDFTEKTDATADPACSGLVSNKLVTETSASDSVSALASTDSADDCSAGRLSDNHEEKAAAAVNEDPGTDNPFSDGPESTPVEKSIQDDEQYEELVEWEDVDDYLVYLEDILRRIHSAYYELYDEMRLNNNSSVAAPDLKTIVPYVRRRVLKGARIVFSGVCPLDADPTTCRIYRVAESLGAVVQSAVAAGNDASSVSEATTHVVAARPGTEKVKAALRQKSVWIVNPDWVWTCADRWEWVDERLYPLNDETSACFLSRDSPEPTAKPRKKDTSFNGRKVEPTSSKATENNGLGTFSLVSLSKEDISGMDAEVEKILDEDSDNEYDDNESEAGNDVIKDNQLCSAEDQDEQDDILRKQVLSGYCGSKRKYEESSDEESLSGDFPKGWKNSSRKRQKVSADGNKLLTVQENDGDDDDDEDGVKSDDSRSGNSSSGDEDFNESVGSVDEEIAAAVEKEFLS